MAHDLGLGTVGLHAHRESADPDIAIIAPETGNLGGIGDLLGRFAMGIGAADSESLARVIGKLRAGITLVKIPSTIRPDGQAVQAVVMLASIETREQHRLLIRRRIIDTIVVNVGIKNQIRRLRNDNLTVDVRHAQGRFQINILGEDRHLICFASTGGILKDDDTVTFFAATGLAAIVDAFGDIHATAFIKIDVGRIKNLRRSRPDGDLETFWYCEHLWIQQGRSRIEIDEFQFTRSFGEDHETNIGIRRLAVTDCTAVIDGDLGAETDHVGREVVADDGIGMRSDTFGINLTGDL